MFYKINGTEVHPSPTSLHVEWNNLYGENTGRDESGVTHLELIRARVRKVAIKHEMLTFEEKEAIEGLLNPRGFQFTLPKSQGGQTFKAYAGPVSPTMKAVDDTHVYFDISFNVIEL